MSKHTTKPFIRAGYGNSHVSELSLAGGYAQTNPQDIGNWNKHKKRRVPSRVRTVGRLARTMRRIAEGRSERLKCIHPNSSVIHAARELNEKYRREAEKIVGAL